MRGKEYGRLRGHNSVLREQLSFEIFFSGAKKQNVSYDTSKCHFIKLNVNA